MYRCTPSKETFDFRKSLRCVNGARSPGGTLITKAQNNETTGEGMTPMLARALKRKFEASLFYISFINC